MAYLNVTIALLIINTKLKISVHVAGVAGIAVDAVYVFGWMATPVFLLIPFVAWVRYRMGVHSLEQLMLGAIFSIIISFLTFSAFYPI